MGWLEPAEFAPAGTAHPGTAPPAGSGRGRPVPGHRAAVHQPCPLPGPSGEILNRDERYRDELTAWTRYDERAADGVLQAVGGPVCNVPGLLRGSGGEGGGSPLGRPDFEREPLLTARRPVSDVVAG